jgi:hypothetical protein
MREISTRTNTVIVVANPIRGMDVRDFCVCCPMYVAALNEGLIPRPRSPTNCL